MSFIFLVVFFPVFQHFSKSQSYSFFLSFWHLALFISFHRHRVFRLPEPSDPAYSGAHALDSSSPHFSLTQVLFIPHWSFIWALTRDLLCKAASSRFFLCPWHLLKILSASQVSNHSLLPASLLHNISLIFLLTVHPLTKHSGAPTMNQALLGSGDSDLWPGPWPWSALGLPQWVTNAIARRNPWI